MAIEIRCPKHKRYNPARDGQGAIKGGCAWCVALWKVYVEASREKLGVK